MELYTTKDIVEKLSPKFPNLSPEAFSRQVRYWSNNGLLTIDPILHGGTGRHREYTRDSLLIAAIICELSQKGVPVGHLKMASIGLKKWLGYKVPGAPIPKPPSPDSPSKDALNRAANGEPFLFIFFYKWQSKGAPLKIGNEKGHVMVLPNSKNVHQYIHDLGIKSRTEIELDWLLSGL